MASRKDADQLRYTPLGEYLRGLRPSQAEVTLSFNEEAESIIDNTLPNDINREFLVECFEKSLEKLRLARKSDEAFFES